MKWLGGFGSACDPALHSGEAWLATQLNESRSNTAAKSQFRADFRKPGSDGGLGIYMGRVRFQGA